MAARPHGTKRSLEASEQGEQGDDCDSDDCEQGDDCDSDGVYANKATIATATENYTVYTYHEDHYSDYYDQDYYYHPDHFDFKVKSLPKLTCRGCKQAFTQKSVLEYNLHDEWIPQRDDAEDECAGREYADLQFHQYGDLCLWCRAPLPGEGHFENRHVHDGAQEGVNHLSEFFPAVFGVAALRDLVYEYFKPQELPAYTAADRPLENDQLHADLIDLYRHGLTHMTVPGVEHVYWREGKYEPDGRVVPQLVDIKLDYRYFRPKQCRCVKTPCECICFAAQVKNITKVLRLTTQGPEYKVLGTLTYPTKHMHTHDFDEDNRLSFFVYLRDLDIDTHIAKSWPPFFPLKKRDKDMRAGPPEGMCRSEWISERVQATHHTPACKRRNDKYESYQCMMSQGRCGRCADCVDA